MSEDIFCCDVLATSCNASRATSVVPDLLRCPTLRQPEQFDNVSSILQFPFASPRCETGIRAGSDP